MAFPQTPLPIKQEININGTWTDITSRTRGGAEVNITRGYSGEQANVSAGTCSFTLNNRDYYFSNANPTSVNYGLLGRNTPYRTGIDTGTVSVRYLDMPTLGTTTYDGSTVWAPDSAALDITGDIDVAVDVDFHDLVGRRGHILLSKYNGGASNQRSWCFTTTITRQLQLIWSTDGTSTNRIFATCPVQINPTGRVQYRVTLDVNNGSGGWTASFYVGTGTDVSGPWSLLGTTSGTGTTSIFASTARVECGTVTNAASWLTFLNGTDSDPFVGWFYGATIRNGIGGTLVAFMNAYQQTAGTTSWTDTVSNTWTVTGSSYLSSIDYRFYGEIPSLPNRSDISGKDIYIPATVNDVLARLTTGSLAKPLPSPIFRNLSQYAWNGYWPMEQATNSTAINASIGKSGTVTLGSFTGPETDFAGSAGSLQFSDDNGYAQAYCATSTGTPTTATYLFYFKLSALPGSASYAPLIEFFPQGGNALRITVYANNSTYRMIIIDQNGAALADVTPGTYGGSNSPINWTAMRVKLSSSGGTINWEFAWYQTNSPVFYGNSGSYTGTMGRPLFWRSEAWTGKNGMQLDHICMGSFDFDFTTTDFVNSTNAYNGETWSDRARRLGAENEFPIYIEGQLLYNGDSSFVKQMGVQGLKSLADLLKECAQVSGGDLIVPREKYGLAIRSFEQEANLSGPQLTYSGGAVSNTLEHEPDTFLIENDVTLTNPAGSQFRYVKTTGTLNASDPSTGVANAAGTYDVSDNISLYKAADLEGAVRRRVMRGTWDEPRYPQIQVQLERSLYVASAALTAQVRKVDLGRPITLTNLTPNLSYNNVDLLVTGYNETYSQFKHLIKWNARPYGPWETGVWGSAALPTTSLWGAKSTYLKTGVNTTATSLVFETTDVLETWSTTASGYQVEIQGERMTVVSVGARSGTGPYDYAVTVARSTNGVVKSLAANSPVTVVSQGRWA